MMEEKSLRFATFFLMFLTVMVCVTLPTFPTLHTMAVEDREERLAQEEWEANQSQVQMQDLQIKEEDVSSNEIGGEISLKLPDGVDGSEIGISNDYLTQTIRIEIPRVDRYYFDSDPIAGSSNHIDTLSYAMTGEYGVIEIAMDQVYELDTAYSDQKYFLNFLTPREIYDRVIVIDAGHGGRAPGATKKGIKEKDIDLAILLQLKDIFEESGENIGVYFTRTDDSNPTFDQRVQLANKSNANLFVSVHNNSTRSGRMSSVSGTQVMYDETSEFSRRFAEICLEEVTGTLGSRNKGLVEGDSIYIIRTSEVPVALIEVGFMTNEEELSLLNTEEYQRQAAMGIYQAIHRAFEEGF